MLVKEFYQIVISCEEYAYAFLRERNVLNNVQETELRCKWKKKRSLTKKVGFNWFIGTHEKDAWQTIQRENHFFCIVQI